MDGDHSLATCEAVTGRVLSAVFEALNAADVYLPGIVLKPNMITAGAEAAHQPTIGEVAEATVRCLRAQVPEDVPGIAFLSGGQSEQLATAHLNAMISQFGSHLPWRLTFSYGRALQASALEAWGGRLENTDKAQTAFTHRAQMNSLAALGHWAEQGERAVA